MVLNFFAVELIKLFLVNVFGGEALVILVKCDRETDFLANVLHGLVFRQNLTDNPVEFFIAADLHEAAEQFTAQALPVPTVADQQGEFRLIEAVQFAQPADAEDLGFPALVRLVLGDERDFAVDKPFLRTGSRETSPTAARLPAESAG